MNIKLIKVAFILMLLFSSALVMAQRNVFRTGSATVASTATISSGSIANLNDGSTATTAFFTRANTASTIDITITCAKPERVEDYTVNFTSSTYSARQITIAGSNDGTAWTTLDNRTVAIAASVSATFTNTNTYTYYRFTFGSINTTTLRISELSGYGTEILAPTLTTTAGATGNLGVLSWTQEIRGTGNYEIERLYGTDGFKLLTTVAQSVLTLTQDTLKRNTSYFYRIRVKKGDVYGPYSEIKELKTANDILLNKPVFTVLPSATLSSTATLNWSLAIGGAGSFDIEKSTNGTDFTLLTNVNKSITTYTDATLVHNTPYWYRVRGKNDISTSPYSDVIKITTISDELTAAPVLTASSSTGSQANLSWTYGTFNTSGGFEMEKSTDGTTFVSMGKVDKMVKAYTDESLSFNTDYWYRVRAYNYVGNSPYSAVVRVKTNNLPGVAADITDDGGTLRVSAENSGGVNAGEGSPKFIDNNVATKWLVFSAQASGALSATYQPTGSYILTGYTLTTANDAAPRDPRDWTFAGSDDNLAWTTLDTRTNQLGANVERYATVSYQFAAPVTKAYKYYRINFTANNGSTDGVRYQIAEWQIMGLDANSPDIPNNLAVTGTTLNSISLSWAQGQTKPVKQFELQRSTDGMNYEKITNLPNTATTFTDANLYDGATYYYRIRSMGENATTISGWSNVATGKTLSTPGIPLAPAYLTADDIKDTAISLKWTDRSDDETGFSLERSRDNVLFEEIKTFPANTKAYVDTTVWAGSYFYYRISAIKDKIKSAYSNTLTVLTTGINTPPDGPFKNHATLSQSLCTGTGEVSLSLNGLKSGPGFESIQKMQITSVKANDDESAKFFSAYTFDPKITNGIANYKVTTSGLAAVGDSAFVKITIKDDGGTIAYGSDSTEFVVKIYFVPLNVKITSDKGTANIARYSLVNLTASSNFPKNTSFQWAPADGIEGDRNGIKLMVRPTRETTYTLTATTPSGCSTTASITLKPQDSLVVSGVITPNGDGKNDTWIIWGIEKKPNNLVKVTDRQGRLVFTSRNYQNDWDGTANGSPLPKGGYYYIIETGDGNKPQKGVLTIIK